MICEHKLAKDQVEVLKKAYMEEYNKLAKTTFTANQEAPVLGQSNNHITFLAAIKKVQEDVGPKNDASFEMEDVEEFTVTIVFQKLDAHVNYTQANLLKFRYMNVVNPIGK